MGDHSGDGIEAVQAGTVGADPERSAPVFKQDRHFILRDRCCIARIVPELKELSRACIEPVQTAAFRAAIQNTRARFTECDDVVVTDRTRAIAGMCM